MKNLFYFILATSLLVACKKEGHSEPAIVSFDGISTVIKPGDNFFAYMNQTWMDTITIADDQAGVGSYSFLNIPQQELLKNILEEVAAGDHPKGSIEQKVGDFYASGMDTASINQRGIEPIKPILAKIDGIKDLTGLINFVTAQTKMGNYSFIAPRISPDQKNSTINILHFSQTGLGLPDRDYYFMDNVQAVAIQTAYKTLITTLFNLVNEDQAEAKANKVYAIEKQLAASHKTRVERRIIKENYHKMAAADLNAKYSNLGWLNMLKGIGTTVDSVEVSQPAYYEKLNSLLGSVPLEDWKLYLKASSIGTYAGILSKPFQDATFAYSKLLSGQSEQQSRAKQIVRRVDRQIGFDLGQLYVKRYFNEDAKKRALDLVNNFQKALEIRINNLEWMGDSTKIKAIEKLYAINKKIGYPDVWRKYEVDISRDHFFENVVALQQDAYNYRLKQLNKAPDKDHWGTTPSTVTAYYNPSLNEIVFPAGILQAPYFDLYADDAVNYGGIGMVIGHEYTHAFDDQGAQYDKDGNVSNWWTADDYTKFKAKTNQIVEQYSGFTVLDSVHLIGKMTVGENTADNGGIAIAFEAFKMTDQGKDSTKIGGFTPDQRFFMSIARIWRVKTREAYLRNYVKTNSHSPPIWRVNGPLMNFTPFYEAFGVKPGDKNYKTEEERIKIW